MINKKIVLGICCSVALALSGCSRQQSDWQKTRETNTADAYEQFLKKYPSGEFTAQAQARVKELYEVRDWQKARDADTPEAYQAFLKQYPEGKWTEEARIRVENFTLAQAPSGAGATSPPDSAGPGAATPGLATGVEPSPPSSAPSVAPLPRVAPATHAAVAQKPAGPATGSHGVQLGAFKSGSGAAQKRWANLQREYPALFAGLSSKVTPARTSSGTLYRLQVWGVTEKHAREICSSLKAKDQGCVVIRPGQA